MERRNYIAMAGTLLTGAFAGCSGQSDADTNSGTADEDTTEQTGILSTAVSDQPADIGDFEKLEVTIEEVWVHPVGSEDTSDAETEDESSTETVTKTEAETTEDSPTEESTPESSEDEEMDDENDSEDDDIIRIDVDSAKADLVKLQGDAQKIINSEEIPVGEFSQVKLWVGDDVNAILNDGSETEVITPGNAPLKFNKEFEVRPSTKTTFTADFAPHKRGPNGYVIRPVAEEVKVTYTSVDDGTEEGTDSTTEQTTETPAETTATEE